MPLEWTLNMSVTPSRVKVDLSTIFLGLICTILVGGVPWAYGIHGRLTRIETKLEIIAGVEARISACELRIQDLEKDVAVIDDGRN